MTNLGWTIDAGVCGVGVEWWVEEGHLSGGCCVKMLLPAAVEVVAAARAPGIAPAHRRRPA